MVHMTDAVARINAETRADRAAKDAVKAVTPAWAKALIVAELHEDISDSQSDYFNSRTTRVVALGWSKHTRDLFPELRKAAASFPDTAHLATGGTEHREKYSMGHGFYLAGDGGRYSGWQVRKVQSDWMINRHTDVHLLGYGLCAPGSVTVAQPVPVCTCQPDERYAHCPTHGDTGPSHRAVVVDHALSFDISRTLQRAATDAIIAEDVASGNTEVGTLAARVDARVAAMAAAPFAHVDTGDALQADVTATLRALIDRTKPQMYSTPEYAAAAADTDALGLLVSKFLKWDGVAVLQLAASALDDSNFHEEAALVARLAEQAV